MLATHTSPEANFPEVRIGGLLVSRHPFSRFQEYKMFVQWLGGMLYFLNQILKRYLIAYKIRFTKSLLKNLPWSFLLGLG